MRKAVQIATCSPGVGYVSTLVVLCDDGAILEYAPFDNPPWKIFPKIPSREDKLNPVLNSTDEVKSSEGTA